MIAGSLTQIKFWNKKSPRSQLMMTGPSCLDNYFKCVSTRVKCGDIPNQNQFNSLENEESLQSILSKRLRKVKIPQHSQKILQTQLKFINKHTNESRHIKLEQIITYYQSYKQKQIIKAFNQGTINQKIVRPFIKIYSTIRDKQFKLSFKQSVVQRQFNKLFNKLLQQEKFTGRIQVAQHQQIQMYFNHTRQNTNVNIINKADKLLEQIQENQLLNIVKNQRTTNNSDRKRYKNNLQEDKHEQKSIHSNSNCHEVNKKVGGNKKLKFKQLNQTEIKSHAEVQDDYDQLVRQLGLLIQDTDKILKQHQQE